MVASRAKGVDRRDIDDAIGAATQAREAATAILGQNVLTRWAGKLAKMETSNRDAKTAGPIATRMREMIMPHTFNRFYEKATGWLYDFDPRTLPAVRRG
ncbi:MAG TPA: hypothetical protein VK280_28755 [Streptosporangiaceae bacterium]|nr:hypothetical protein [Streptosporangiaceae bacterium]